MSEFNVKPGVEVAPLSEAGRRPIYPYGTMEVGSYFFVPDRTTAQISTYAAKRGKELGRRFSTQTAIMRQDLETNEWEPCKPGAPGCRHGTAVKRLA